MRPAFESARSCSESAKDARFSSGGLCQDGTLVRVVPWLGSVYGAGRLSLSLRQTVSLPPSVIGLAQADAALHQQQTREKPGQAFAHGGDVDAPPP